MTFGGDFDTGASSAAEHGLQANAGPGGQPGLDQSFMGSRVLAEHKDESLLL